MAIDRAAMRMIFSCQFWRMAICWTFALLFSYLRFHLRGRCLTQHPRFRFSLDPGGKIRRPICIITGATSGLGEATARAMAAEGYHVVVAGRCSEKLDKIIQDIMKGNESAHLNAFQVDLSSFHSILKFERSFKQWLLDSNLDPSVQLLINNAGILATSFKVSADGYDKMMQTNYLGAFALTNLLLPLLKKSPVPSRIVNITSFTHRCVTNLKLDCNIFSHSSSSEKYPFANVYENSKLCLLLFSYELHRRLYEENPLSNISIIPVDPGVVKTNILREIPLCLSQLAFTVLSFLRLLQSPETGASSVVDTALAPPNVSGEYFFGGKGRMVESSSLSYNAKLAADLWSKSSTLFEDQIAIHKDF